MLQWASMGAQMVKYLSAMQETPVPSLNWEDPLENGMTTYSSILAWRIPWTEGYSLWGHCKVKKESEPGSQAKKREIY